MPRSFPGGGGGRAQLELTDALTLRYLPGNCLMWSCNRTFFTLDAFLVLCLLLVSFMLRSLAIGAGSPIRKLSSLDAILLPVKAGAGTDTILWPVLETTTFPRRTKID